MDELAGKSWEALKNELPKSIGASAALVTPCALARLGWLVLPALRVSL